VWLSRVCLDAHLQRWFNFSQKVKCFFAVHGMYAMTKFAVEALNDALRREMLPLGVSVSMINPGLLFFAFFFHTRGSGWGVSNYRSFCAACRVFGRLT
jgi:NAD(P)-dependent dehydrogenase (short-subunit alcohol dehydrogenase family)